MRGSSVQLAFRSLCRFSVQLSLPSSAAWPTGRRRHFVLRLQSSPARRRPFVLGAENRRKMGEAQQRSLSAHRRNRLHPRGFVVVVVAVVVVALVV